MISEYDRKCEILNIYSVIVFHCQFSEYFWLLIFQEGNIRESVRNENGRARQGYEHK